MKCTDTLRDEHREIERVLDAVEAAAHLLQGGVAVRPGFFLEATDFVAGFADGTHHYKEERLLFPAMVRAGLSGDAGPIAAMLGEHEEGRRLTQVLRQAAMRLAGGDMGAAGALGTAVRRYAHLLRDHIAKEDNVLFPMADRLLSPEAEREVNGGFEQAGRDAADTRAEFRALADALVREVDSLT